MGRTESPCGPSLLGLWDLRMFQGDTDVPWYFQRIFGDPLTRPERYEADSPHLNVAKIRTPMLVIHGARTTGSSSRTTHACGSRRSSTSSTTMSSAPNGSNPACCSRAECGSQHRPGEAL